MQKHAPVPAKGAKRVKMYPYNIKYNKITDFLPVIAKTVFHWGRGLSQNGKSQNRKMLEQKPGKSQNRICPNSRS